MSDSPFIKMLKEKHTELDVDKMLQIFDQKIGDIKRVHGPKGLKLPLDCDLNKALFGEILREYLKE